MDSERSWGVSSPTSLPRGQRLGCLLYASVATRQLSPRVRLGLQLALCSVNCFPHFLLQALACQLLPPVLLALGESPSLVILADL